MTLDQSSDVQFIGKQAMQSNQFRVKQIVADDPVNMSNQNSSFSTSNEQQSSQSFRRKAKAPMGQSSQQNSVYQLASELKLLKSEHAQAAKQYEQKIQQLQGDIKNHRLRYKNLEDVNRKLKAESDELKSQT